MNIDQSTQAQPRKLALKKETLRQLTASELRLAAGGWIRPPISLSCPQPSMAQGPKAA
jgi:hypothetical protein